MVGAVQRLLSGASDPHNLIVNGGGEEGTLGSQATGWTFGNRASFLAVAEDEVHSGARSLKIANGSASDSFSYQVTGSGTLRLYCQLSYTGAQSGTAWFDDVVVCRLYRIRTEDIDEATVATRYAANGNTGTFGAETVICTTGIGGTFQTGFTSVYGRANCTTIPTGVIAVVRVWRHPRLGGARSCEQAQDACDDASKGTVPHGHFLTSASYLPSSVHSSPTPAVSCARKRERSGRWRASAPVPDCVKTQFLKNVPQQNQ